MAGSDVFGILSLLIAAGGAAYLLRARFLGARAPLATEPGARSRTANTVPPKLRPADDADDPASSRAPGASKTKSLPPPSDPVIPRQTPLPKDLTKVAGIVDPPKKAEAPKPTPKAPPSVRKPEVAAPAPSKPAAKKAEAPKADAPKAEAVKATLKSAPSARVEATPAPKKTEPAKKAEPARKSEPAKIEVEAASADEPRGSRRDAKQTWSKERARKPASTDELPVIPNLNTEEDEDVEPTRVGKVVRKEIQPPVEKHVLDEGAETEPTGTLPKWSVFATAQTDPGKRRKQNEDSHLLLEKHGLYVVADGMGGHRGGQRASKLAVQVMTEAFEKKTFEAAPHPGLPLAASELARAIQMANAAILSEANATPELKGMGTTLCSARFTHDGHRLYIGHVGDSRCYRVRDGSMKQMTSDHTMADYGVTGPEGAHLSRAVGVWPTVPIDILMCEPKPGDLYLLCSDGLTKMLPAETISTQLLHEEDPRAAVERLVFFANAHGGKDNITVLLLRVTDTAPKARPKD